MLLRPPLRSPQYGDGVGATAHWLLVGQPVPLVKGQHTQAQAVLPETVMVVALTADCPLPVTLPGSPEP